MNIPVSTYRLQFTPSFGFKQARNIIPYLSSLGISDIYASPIFLATEGSDHGYDVVDQNIINPELGHIDDFETLMKTVKSYKMGWVQDIVPNHMAFHSNNCLLCDVLEKGKYSRFFDFFDIRWELDEDRKIVLPFLGSQFTRVLETGEITLCFGDKGFFLQYYDKTFPLNFKSYTTICGSTHNNQRVKEVSELLESLTRFIREKPCEDRDQKINELKQRFWRLYCDSSSVKPYIDHCLDVINDTSDIKLLEKVLSQQYYKLCFWKTCNDRVNYRRFFHLTEYIGLNVHHRFVFDYIHQLIFRLSDKKKFTGLRIDHIDGLYNPLDYLQWIRKRDESLYLIVEKILSNDEALRTSWPIHGTTGYEFANILQNIMIEMDAEEQISAIYHEFVGKTVDHNSLLRQNKKSFIQNYLMADINYLLVLIDKIYPLSEKENRDRKSLACVLVEIIACFKIYRTYVNSKKLEIDNAYIVDALNQAKKFCSDCDNEFELISTLLLHPDIWCDKKKNLATDFIKRFQQITAPAMAKGFEDTFLYNYNRFISLNDVGTNPNIFGISKVRFHQFNEQRNAHFRFSLNASSTHDSKRAEDVRARLNVLSEIPMMWREKVNTWRKLNEPLKRQEQGISIPSENDEYMLYQTLIGSWPFFTDEKKDFTKRIQMFVKKAVRESKIYSNWIKPHRSYEHGCDIFIHNLLTRKKDNPFFDDFISFQKKIAVCGIWNSLSQVLLKATSPGIPDFYQGSEYWNFNLVDPDNRRPVDFETRKKSLIEIQRLFHKNPEELVKELVKAKEDGRIKQFLIWRALDCRKAHTDLFNRGSYIPLKVKGLLKNHVIAFARHYQNEVVIIIAPRFFFHLSKKSYIPIGSLWKETQVNTRPDFPHVWTDWITNNEQLFEKDIAMDKALALFPVCLLYGSRS